MRMTPGGGQLVLEWTDRVRWDELPMAARAELHALLRELLRRGAPAEDLAEGAVDE